MLLFVVVFFYFIITDKFVKTQTELYEPLSEYFSQFNMQYKRQNSGRIKNNRENTAAMENKRMPRNSVIQTVLWIYSV